MPESSVLGRIPVVGGLAYVDHVRRLPSSFSATLAAEPNHRYFPHAIAVLVAGEKVGYVAPEVALRYFTPLAAVGGAVCPGRRAAASDRDTSGVELLLDFSGLAVAPSE